MARTKQVCVVALAATLALWGCESDSEDPMDGGGMKVDSGGGDKDSGGPGEEDSGTEEDAGGGGTDGGGKDGGSSCTDLNPSNPADGDLVIAEVDPTGFILFYNPTGSDINFGSAGTDYRLCAGGGKPYIDMSSTHGAVTVPSKGYAKVAMPGSWNHLGDTNGNVALYENTGYGDGNNQVDFVCWGNAGSPNRKTEAEGASPKRWNGACADSPGAGKSIFRKVGTAGTKKADYEAGTTDGTECP
ncbi:MAG: hypothetical protein KC416_07435 [Myxococcales bacterium]|nr:hypothetical protein [Myxococcales bacterium]